MRAFVIITKKSDWISNIALNYTQLNFDYCMANRINKPDFEFIITDDANLVNIYRWDRHLDVRASFMKRSKKVLQEKVLAELANGELVTALCRRDDMPPPIYPTEVEAGGY